MIKPPMASKASRRTVQVLGSTALCCMKLRQLKPASMHMAQVGIPGEGVQRQGQAPWQRTIIGIEKGDQGGSQGAALRIGTTTLMGEAKAKAATEDTGD